MSTNYTQKSPSNTEKSCCCKCRMVPWIVLLLVVGAGLWLFFGHVINGYGGGNPEDESAAAAEMEKSGVMVIKTKENGVKNLNFFNCLKPSEELLKQLPKLYRLVILQLRDVEITDQQLEYVGKLKTLHSLVLDGTPIGDEGIAHLAGLPDIQTLDLSRTKLTDKGLEHIAKLSTLNTLNVSGTNITDQGLKNVAKIKNIYWVLMMGNNITDAGLAELAGMPELKQVSISQDMKISKEYIEQFKKANPQTKVRYLAPPSSSNKPETAAPETNSAQPSDSTATKNDPDAPKAESKTSDQ